MTSRRGEDRIYATMQAFPLSSAPNFRALSYSWGTGERTHRVLLPEGKFPVTPSLYAALQHVRRITGGPIVLWIDQICINQDNEAEKTAQVKLMGEIYTRAKQVIAWLGPADGTSDSFMELLANFGRDAANLHLDSYLFGGEERRQLLLDILDAKTTGGGSNPTENRIRDLFDQALSVFVELARAIPAWYKRPWFSRVWVIQEFALGSDTIFMCGDKKLVAQAAMLATHVLNIAKPRIISSLLAGGLPAEIHWQNRAIVDRLRSLNPTRPHFAIRTGYQGLGHRMHEGHTLQQLLKKVFVGNDIHATRREDRIFGLLGLAVDAERLGIRPDYTTTEVAPLLYRVALSIINDSKNLDIWSYARPGTDIPNLPSWVPDWRPSLESRFSHLDQDQPIAYRAFSASRRSLMDTGMPPGPDGILRLRGVVVDVVEDIGGTLSLRDPRVIPCLLHGIRHLTLLSKAKGRSIYTSRQRIEEACWRIRIGDLENSGLEIQRRATTSTARSYWELLQHWEGCERWGGPPASVKCYVESMNKMQGMRPYLTREGYVGMGPARLSPGDVIVVLIGASVPFAIRPLERSARVGQFALLGEVYCDGIMDGELMAGDRPFETIDIA